MEKIMLLFICLGLCFSCEQPVETEDNPDPGTGNPVGIHDSGSADGYQISGVLRDESSDPLSGLTVTLAYEIGEGPFDYVAVDTDAQGSFSFTGLADWSIADGEHCIVLSSWPSSGDYERVLYWPLQYHGNYPGVLTDSSIVVDMVLKSVVPGTEIRGRITTSSGAILPKSEIQLLDLLTSSKSQGPAFNVSIHENDDSFSYDESTGDYRIANCLAGGTYELNVNTDTHGYGGSVLVAPGSSVVHDIVLSVTTFNDWTSELITDISSVLQPISSEVYQISVDAVDHMDENGDFSYSKTGYSVIGNISNWSITAATADLDWTMTITFDGFANNGVSISGDYHFDQVPSSGFADVYYTGALTIAGIDSFQSCKLDYSLNIPYSDDPMTLSGNIQINDGYYDMGNIHQN